MTSGLFLVMLGKWTDHVKSWRHTDLGDRILYTTYEAMVEVMVESSYWDLPKLVNRLTLDRKIK